MEKTDGVVGEQHRQRLEDWKVQCLCVCVYVCVCVCVCVCVGWRAGEVWLAGVAGTDGSQQRKDQVRSSCAFEESAHFPEGDVEPLKVSELFNFCLRKSPCPLTRSFHFEDPKVITTGTIILLPSSCMQPILAC